MSALQTLYDALNEYAGEDEERADGETWLAILTALDIAIREHDALLGQMERLKVKLEEGRALLRSAERGEAE